MNFLNMALNNKRCLNCRRGSSRMATFWKVLESPIEMIFIPQKLRSLSIENLFERKHRWGKESLLIRLKCSGVKEISVDQGRRWNQQISICWWLVHIVQRFFTAWDAWYFYTAIFLDLVQQVFSWIFQSLKY
jgi:hypothetical protein